MRRKPRLTKPDPDFGDAVIKELVRYRNAKHFKDAQVADILGVSKPTFSKYLNRQIEIGGPVLARAFVLLQIEVHYRGKVISARDFPSAVSVEGSSAQQISFEFDQPCLLKETESGLAVTVKRKSSVAENIIATIKLAG